MNIHELNNFTGTLGSGAYLAIDDGTDTGKISSQGLLAATEARIDNIIAGPAPSAEEIVDARLGADGVPYPSLGDAIRDQFTDVKSDLNEVISPQIPPHTAVELVDSPSFVKISNASCNVTGTGIVVNSDSDYDSYFWIVDEDTEVFFTNLNKAGLYYVAFCYGQDFTSKVGNEYKCSNAVRKRKSDNNMPENPSTAISLNVGDIAFVTLPKGTSVALYGIPSLTFTQKVDDEIFTETQPTKEKTDYIIEASNDLVGIEVASSNVFTKLSSTSANVNENGIVVNTDADYDTYVWVVNRQTKVYFGQSLPYYVAFCYGSDFITNTATSYFCSNATRKRKSENNLPLSQSDAITLNDGDIIAITIPINTSVEVYGVKQKYVFSDSAKNQITALIPSDSAKVPLVVYDDTVVDNDIERLNIYIPSGVGYIKYDFAHFVSNSNNADVWLIHPLSAVSDDLETRFSLTTTGEFECALKISDAPDFMGGSAHGSEIKQNVYFFVDGAEIDPTSITELTKFDALRIVEQSYLYDPRDETTHVATHGKEYIFTKEKLVINQTVKWVHAESLDYCYLAMLPVAKSVTEKIVTNNDYSTRLFSNGAFSANNIDTAISWDDSVGFSVRFSKPKWEIKGTNIVGDDTFISTDNGGGVYNKQYFVCCTGGSVSVDDIWKATSEYVFEINN